VTSDDGTSIVSMQKETSAAEAKSTSSLSDRRPNDLSISISDEEGIPSEFSPDDPLLSPLSSSTFSPENSDDEDGMKGNVETTDPSNREEMKAVEEEILTREDPTIDKEEREVPHRTEEMSLTPLPHTTNLPSSTSMGCSEDSNTLMTERFPTRDSLPGTLRLMSPVLLEGLLDAIRDFPEARSTVMTAEGTYNWDEVERLAVSLQALAAQPSDSLSVSKTDDLSVKTILYGDMDKREHSSHDDSVRRGDEKVMSKEVCEEEAVSRKRKRQVKQVSDAVENNDEVSICHQSLEVISDVVTTICSGNTSNIFIKTNSETHSMSVPSVTMSSHSRNISILSSSKQYDAVSERAHISDSVYGEPVTTGAWSLNSSSSFSSVTKLDATVCHIPKRSDKNRIYEELKVVRKSGKQMDSRQNIPCKFFTQGRTCRMGRSCSYGHFKTSRRARDNHPNK